MLSEGRYAYEGALRWYVANVCLWVQRLYVSQKCSDRVRASAWDEDTDVERCALGKR
jgi:hypothetical protein